MAQSPDEQTESQTEESTIQRKLTLVDLPCDVLNKVLSKVDYRHQRYLRDVSPELRQLQTNHMMRQYDFEVRNLACLEVDQEFKFQLQIMDEAARTFRQKKYESQFVSTLLHLNELEFEGVPSLIYEFLYHLQLTLDEKPLPRVEVRDLRILYTISLFVLLKKFDNLRIVESTTNHMHWQVVLELPNVFLGVLDERSMNYRTSNRNKRIGIFCILAEMLFYARTNQSYGGFKDTGNIVYTYGYQTGSLPKRKPRLSVKCSVLAPKGVLRLLQHFLIGKEIITEPVTVPLGAPFRARLQVNSLPSKRFYDYRPLHINIFQDDEQTV